MKTVLVEPNQPAVVIDTSFSEIQDVLDCISFAYPFEDPHIALAHDDNGIANGRMPNRTVNGQIMPGPFYVVRVDVDGDVMGLTDAEAEEYVELFAIPEEFAYPGHWTITTRTRDESYGYVIEVVSDWVSGPIPSSAEYLGSPSFPSSTQKVEEKTEKGEDNE